MQRFRIVKTILRKKKFEGLIILSEVKNCYSNPDDIAVRIDTLNKQNRVYTRPTCMVPTDF